MDTRTNNNDDGLEFFIGLKNAILASIIIFGSIAGIIWIFLY